MGRTDDADMAAVIALVDEIKGAIARCRTGAEIDACARHYGPALKVFGASDTHKVRVIHIRNFAAQHRQRLMQK